MGSHFQDGIDYNEIDYNGIDFNGVVILIGLLELVGTFLG